MPDAIAIEQFERRLVELGCPGRPLRERVEELGDHYHDLKAAALADDARRRKPRPVPPRAWAIRLCWPRIW
jgi:hypothetical protein